LVKLIDATDLILGRVASYVAKEALKGEQFIIINSEKAVISGSKKAVFEKYKSRVDRGEPFKGPFFPKRPDLLFKRAIRGMLPYKQDKGRKALKRIKVFIGNPNLESIPEPINMEKMNAKKLKLLKYVKLEELCKYLGWK